MYYPPCNTMFTGMTQAQLVAALAAAQAAYIAVISGQQGVTFSYSQGDGAKSVTYKVADPGALAALIRELQQATGLIPRARRPIQFNFR